MENSGRKTNPLPQVNNPEGLVDLLLKITQSSSTTEQLRNTFGLKSRELSYRLSALSFFELIVKINSKPATWASNQIVGDTRSGINKTKVEEVLRNRILDWNSKELKLRQDMQNSEFEIWEALSKDSLKTLSDATLGRRVTSYKKLVNWAMKKGE